MTTKWAVSNEAAWRGEKVTPTDPMPMGASAGYYDCAQNCAHCAYFFLKSPNVSQHPEDIKKPVNKAR